MYDMSSGETISWLPKTLSLPAIGVPRLFSNFRCPGVRPCRKLYFLEAAFRLIFHFQLSILGDMRYFWGIRGAVYEGIRGVFCSRADAVLVMRCAKVFVVQLTD